jgi:GTPase SAR1 family protein
MEANTKRHRLPLHRALLLGSGGVGKTSLCNSFCLGHFIDTVGGTCNELMILVRLTNHDGI